MLEPDRQPPAEVLAELPVFPLPNVVFLPGMVLPLNVFEPRYLDLVDHVLDHGEHIGVPMIKEGSGGSDTPELEPVFGFGKLVFHRRLPDGRRFIRLEGMGRVKTVRELPKVHRFRQIEANLLEEQTPDDLHSFEVLKAQVERMSRTFEPEDREMVNSILELDDPRIIVYAITALIPNVEILKLGDQKSGISMPCRHLAFQQACLDAASTDDRVGMLLDRAAMLIDRLGETGRFPVALMN